MVDDDGTIYDSTMICCMIYHHFPLSMVVHNTFDNGWCRVQPPRARGTKAARAISELIWLSLPGPSWLWLKILSAVAVSQDQNNIADHSAGGKTMKQKTTSAKSSRPRRPQSS